MGTEVYFAFLSEKPTIFEPISSINSVFFDEANQQVFTLRSRGTMGVNVKSPDQGEALNFRIDDRGDVLSIKFSLGNQVLGIQRNLKSLDFLNFTDNIPAGAEYSQACKGKGAKIIGFVWTGPTEILYITNEQLELYQVCPAKRSLRLLKQITLACHWFLWDSASRVLIASSGPKGCTMNLFHAKAPGTVNKLCKFELSVDPVDGDTDSDTAVLPRRNCLLSTVYNNLYFLFLRRARVPTDALTRKIYLYRLKPCGSARLTDVLLVPLDGPVALSFVDNLVLVHNQAVKVTLVYDISVRAEMKDSVLYHRPVISPKSIAPYSLASSTVPSLSSNLGAQVPIELYSPNWVINLPNIIIDGSLGCLWTLKIDNRNVPLLIEKRAYMVDFLLNRVDTKQILLNYCSSLAVEAVKEAMSQTESTQVDYSFNPRGLNERLDIFAYMFKRFGELLGQPERKSSRQIKGISSSAAPSLPSASQVESKEETGASQLSSAGKPALEADEYFVTPCTRRYTVDQNEVYEHVFLSAQGNENANVRRFFYAVLVEYIRSLVEHDIPVDHSLYELLLGIIARLGDYAQLSYCIQSRFLADSKPIALQLLALETVYPTAGQLAMDMLKRLNFSNEELLDVLLLKNKPLEALRLCQSRPHLLQDKGLARRILKVAQGHEGQLTFFAAFRFFELLNLRTRNDPKFQPDDDCDEFVKRFVEVYGESALLSFRLNSGA
ncbi:unnamed protein product [Calicophoron daubneyi]|uniref:Mic1 domain-containing protein n=1 Tax=Calicophoron daubneyi TaxID=300641 RepID=A0AAV2TNZ8_CALDB